MAAAKLLGYEVDILNDSGDPGVDSFTIRWKQDGVVRALIYCLQEKTRGGWTYVLMQEIIEK